MSRVLIDESSNYYMKKEIVKILRDNRILYLVDFYRSDDTKLSRILKGHLSLKASPGFIRVFFSSPSFKLRILHKFILFHSKFTQLNENLRQK